MYNILSAAVVAVASTFFFSRRLLHYLRYFQQDNYEGLRFLRWVVKKHLFDKKGASVALLCGLLAFLGMPALWVSLVGSAALVALALWLEDPRRNGKLRLHMTNRARDIYRTAMAVYAVLVLVTYALSHSSVTFLWFTQPILFQLSALLLVLSKALLQPREERRQRAFRREATDILQDVAPYVIGITGSYGKTSTKLALGQILNTTLLPTFWPKAGVNTPMGIVREIREDMKRFHRYAVIEMAAYQKGSIARICALTPPKAGIVTGVGLAHLERFKSQDVIRRTKAELAEALPADGILVCNGDNEGARSIAAEHRKKTTLLYGLHPERGALDVFVSSWQVTDAGTSFVVVWRGREYHGVTALYGEAALSNLVAAFTMACEVGADPEFALAVIRNVEPVDNRLQKVKEGGVTYLRDAYNSNPVGFADACTVIRALTSTRRIVVTPGIIELGSQQYAENVRAGVVAASTCDVAWVVGSTNRKALLEGLRRGGMKEDSIRVFDTRDAALESLSRVVQDGDAVLIENDLPDLYETTVTF